MKNGKWVVYAARASVARFWDLAKVRYYSIFTIAIRNSYHFLLRKRTRWTFSSC